MPLLDILVWAATVPVAIMLVIFTIEILAGLIPSAPSPSVDRSAARICVLIPAHDEGPGIARTLADLFAAAPPGTEVLVVADNCTDQTADLARAGGAMVIERQDATARGKGFALAFGRDWLAHRPEGPPDVLVVLDADCTLRPGSLEALVSRAIASGRPAQATNLITPDMSAPPLVQISSFAMVVKNLYRSRGMQRLGGAALLTGTGMAFLWRHIADARLASGALAEDLELGIALVRAKCPPILAGEAAVFSRPASMRDALVQRTRWEHGFIDSVFNHAGRLLLDGLRKPSRLEFFLGLHLLVPPLALVILLTIPILVIDAVVLGLGGSGAALLVVGCLFAMASAAVMFAWLGQGRSYLSFSALVRVPLYVLWKVPIYLRLIRTPEREWRRTMRDNSEAVPKPSINPRSAILGPTSCPERDNSK